MPLFRRARTHGFPPSGNGASSFHLGWRLPPGAGHLVSASVTLEVLTPPVVDDLYFWALQVTFPGAGAAHLGLQWNHRHPAFGAHICLTVGLPEAVAHIAMAHSGEGELLVRSLECMIVHQADYTFWNTLLAGGQLKPETVPPQTRKYVSDKPF